MSTIRGICRAGIAAALGGRIASVPLIIYHRGKPVTTEGLRC